MTKARATSTVGDAITRIAARIGWNGAAEVVGKSERVVRLWSEDDVDREPRLDEAIALDRAYLQAGGGDPPLLAVYQLALERAAHPVADAAEIAHATSVAAKEFGEAIAASVSAAQPGAPSAARIIAEEEIADAGEALEILRRKVGGAPLATVTPIKAGAA